jgi:hypothetical protein
MNLYPAANNNLMYSITTNRRKKPNPLSKQHDLFRRYIQVFDKEQIFETLLRSKEEIAELKENN